MRKRTWRGMLAAFLLLIALPVIAQIALPSDCLTVFDPNGAIFQQVCATEADEETNTVQHLYVINAANLVDPAQNGNPTILLDPDETISDVFGIAAGFPPGCDFEFCLGFVSDTETQAAFGKIIPPLTFPESLGVFDATFYLAPILRDDGFTAQFVSDAVPEPASIALLGLGVLALSFARRKRLGTRRSMRYSDR